MIAQIDLTLEEYTAIVEALNMSSMYWEMRLRANHTKNSSRKAAVAATLGDYFSRKMAEALENEIKEN